MAIFYTIQLMASCHTIQFACLLVTFLTAQQILQFFTHSSGLAGSSHYFELKCYFISNKYASCELFLVYVFSKHFRATE